MVCAVGGVVWCCVLFGAVGWLWVLFRAVGARARSVSCAKSCSKCVVLEVVLEGCRARSRARSVSCSKSCSKGVVLEGCRARRVSCSEGVVLEGCHARRVSCSKGVDRVQSAASGVNPTHTGSDRVQGTASRVNTSDRVQGAASSSHAAATESRAQRARHTQQRPSPERSELDTRSSDRVQSAASSTHAAATESRAQRAQHLQQRPSPERSELSRCVVLASGGVPCSLWGVLCSLPRARGGSYGGGSVKRHATTRNGTVRSTRALHPGTVPGGGG